MKTIKGFDNNLQCRGFQYEIGKTYNQEGNIKACKNGFHAISEDSAPLSVFNYYAPVAENGKSSRYCEVEASGDIDKTDDKIACSQITIGAEIGIPVITKAHVEWVKKHIINEKKETNTGDHSAATNTGYQSAATNTGDYSAATNTGNYSAATNTGYQSAATNTGYYSAATNTGDYSAATNTGNYSAATNTGNYSAATNTGDYSAATNTGDHSAATNTGDHSAATNTGDYSAATNTGNYSAATNTGYQSAATNTGYYSAATNTGNCSAATNTGNCSAASVEGKDSVAIATGYQSKAKGALGCAIVVVERGDWNGGTYPLKAICSAIVDGVKIKADTWYTVKDGQFVEVED